MSRPDADPGRRKVDIAGIKDAASKHGSDRKALRRAARYAGMGQVSDLSAGQGFLPESVIGTPDQNEGQPKI